MKRREVDAGDTEVRASNAERGGCGVGNGLDRGCVDTADDDRGMIDRSYVLVNRCCC